jgi:hypothetical protein
VVQRDVESRWPKRRLVVLTSITIGVAAIVSFTSIQSLALHAGFGWRSWMYPLLIDAVAAAGYEVWMTRSRARRPAIVLALFAVTLSLIANVSDWWITQGTYEAAVLGAVPPAMLAALLFVVHRHTPVQVWFDDEPAADEPVVRLVHQVSAERLTNGRLVPMSAELVHQNTQPLVHGGDGGSNRAGAPDRDPGAPGLVEPDEPAAPEGPTVSTSPASSPDEEKLIGKLRAHPELDTLTRRSAERLLTGWAGEKVGSSRAGRLLSAARSS